MAIVWASNVMINPAMLRPFAYSFPGKNDQESLEAGILARRKNEAGESLGSEYFPTEIYVPKGARANYVRLPHLFFAGCYWVVSDRVTDVMQKFDLGGCNLHPVKVVRKDRKTSIGDSWYCLNFGNVKAAFLPEYSIKKRPLGPSKTFWLPDDLEDYSVSLRQAALDGPEIWVDAIFGNTFFVSDPLAKALRTAGVAGSFGLRKCQLI